MNHSTLESGRCIFNKSQYNDADQFAREKTRLAIRKMIEEGTSLPLTIEDNPDQYGIDLFLFLNGKKIGSVECEKSYVWHDGPFPYNSIRLPNRKEKFINLDSKDNQVWISMVNSKGTTVALYKAETAKNCPQEWVENKRTGGEYMRIIPTSQIKQVRLDM